MIGIPPPASASLFLLVLLGKCRSLGKRTTCSIGVKCVINIPTDKEARYNEKRVAKVSAPRLV